MKINFCLEKILEEHKDMGRGVIKRICARTSLERHQVAAILNNTAKYVSLQTLAGICKYLVERHRVDPALLPGLLFEIEPEEFSALLASRQHIEIILGMRTEPHADPGGHPPTAVVDERPRRYGLRRQWVMAADSYLHGVLLHELAGLRREGHQEKIPQFMEQQLVAAFDRQRTAEELAKDTQQLYANFEQVPGDKALVALGSVKSNILVEQIVARAFHAQPFASEDNAAKPQKRHCPIFLRYRDDDPAPPSCHGGTQLARGQASPQPGIYYETADGHWECCPSDEHHDVAIVLYVYHLTLGRLEMVLGGFSGRATLCLASSFRHLTDKLWPPVYSRDDKLIGAFLVRFDFDGTSRPADDEQPLDWATYPTKSEVIRLDESVIARRMEG